MFILKRIKKLIGVSTLAIATVVSGVITAGLSTSVNAVNLSSDNLGDAMIFPYYTTRNGFATFFNITNTSGYTILLKVRWIEGENGRQAQAFNVILSPYDVWTAATIGSSNGGARIVTSDSTCTSPQLPIVGTTAEGDVTTGTNFTNVAFTGSNFDTGNTGLDRTREGYFTVFEMGVLDHGRREFTDEQRALSKLIARSVFHNNLNNNNGVPGDGDLDDSTNCGFIDNLFTDNTGLAKLSTVTYEPQNILKGRAVLIELSTGVAFGYDPIVFENFFSPQGVDAQDTNNLLALPTQPTPNLNSANPASISVVLNNEIVFTGDTFERPVDVISFLLSSSTIINDYNITSGSQTDWVITFPTKAFYVDRQIGALTGSAFKLPASSTQIPVPLSPFLNAGGELFADPDTNNDGKGDTSNSTGESCLPFSPRMWDREAFEPQTAFTFFGVPFPHQINELCKETNILSFGGSNIFDSKLRRNLIGQGVILESPGLNGWAQISFTGQGAALPLATTGTISITGLPVAGMRIEARRNSKFAGKNYGFASDHIYK